MNCYLFIYGTLLQNSNNEFALFLKKNSNFFCFGSFIGTLFDLGEYPGAVFNISDKREVKGHVIRLLNAEDVLSKLDVYEGFGEQFEKPNEFVRIEIPVLCDNTKYLDCWVYLYNRTVENCKIIESGDFADYMKTKK